MEDFNILVPFEKSTDSEGTLKMFGGIASSTSVDRDDERMDKSVLNKIATQLKGATVFFNHDIKGLGVGKVIDSIEKGENVEISVVPTKAKGMSDVVTQINEGILKSFSIGGRILKVEEEFDNALNKDIRVIKDVEMYEVSVVGVPANKDASILSYMAKSLKKGVNLEDKNNDNKPDPAITKAVDVLETPEFKKMLSDLKEDYSAKFVKMEEDLTAEKSKNEELDKAVKALTARNDELHKSIDDRVKSLQAEQAIGDGTAASEDKAEDTKKGVEEVATFM